VTAERFSLLPAHYEQRVAERRWAKITGGALVVVLALLVLAGLSQGHRLRRAENRRDVEQARNTTLVARGGELRQFRQLADAVAGRERQLTAAMGTEVSWASLLTGLGTSFPTGSSLTSISVESKLTAFGALPAVKAGDQKAMIGTAVLNGYSVETFTPGVQRLLQMLLTVEGLSEPRLQAATRSEIGKRPVTTFEGSAFLDGGALSGRYAQGLPAENDIDIPVLAGGGATPATQPEFPAARK
jgi:Tfp pilus assembly protein PilN